MQLFLFFLLFSFIGGVIFWSEKSRQKAIVLIVLASIIMIGYFFFNQL